jgi:S-methylmethionine-dependent homocysteine/selenocysteine methylase
MRPAATTNLPQLAGTPFLTDGGLETCLVYHEGLDLPCFAAFDLLKGEEGLATLRRYFLPYVALAREARTGFVFESPTWRASRDWGDRLGYGAAALAAANRRAMELGAALRRDAEGVAVVLSGCVGPRGDGYSPTGLMTAAEARGYHAEQVRALASGGAEMISAVTMTHAGEAIGITLAAADAGLPVAISFTVETDGRLPSGQELAEAIAEVDDATDATPAYFMVNCAHPTHFADLLALGEAWTRRIRGLRANASRRSHAELDAATELDDGDPLDLGARYAELHRAMPQFAVLGGCCGTDHRHVAAIARACLGTPDLGAAT